MLSTVFLLKCHVAKDYIYKRLVKSVVQSLMDERKRVGLSMNTLSKMAGISQSTLSLVEHDKRSPTLDTLLRISMALNFDLGKSISKALSHSK
jgi:predicted transcriptional regulator